VIIKEMRAEYGIKPAGKVDLTFTFSTTPPAEPPLLADIAAALEVAPAAKAAFSRARSHRKEYIRHIEEAKRADTRAARIAATMRTLTEAPGRP